MISSLLRLSHRYILSNTLVRSLTRLPNTASISKWLSTLRLGSSQMFNRVLLERNTLLVTLVGSSAGSSFLQIGQEGAQRSVLDRELPDLLSAEVVVEHFSFLGAAAGADAVHVTALLLLLQYPVHFPGRNHFRVDVSDWLAYCPVGWRGQGTADWVELGNI